MTKKGFTFALPWIFCGFICACALDYCRGQTATPTNRKQSTARTNRTASDDNRFAGYAYPGDARGLWKKDNWFMDSYGRYVLFRGVNIDSQSKKGPLYLPLRINSFADGDAELKRISPCLNTLQNLGFNVVRLSIMWKGLEPTPGGGLSQQYIRELTKFIDALYQRGLFVIVEFHQDIVSDLYGGDGFPDWALAVDKEHPLPRVRPHPSSRWFLRYEEIWDPIYMGLDPHWPWDPPLNDLVRNTERSFWSNRTDNALWHLKGYPTQTALVHTIGGLAKVWKTNPAVIGYDLFNEPNDAGFGRPKFEENYLTPFYTQSLREIRTAARDTNSFLFVEPRTDWDFFPTNSSQAGLSFVDNGSQIHCYLGENDSNSFLHPGRTNNNERAVFSFHFYDSWTAMWAGFGFGDNMATKARQWPGIFQAMVAAGTNRNLIPFLTEFGAQNSWRQFSTSLEKGFYETEDRAYLDLSLRQVEANLLNAAVWDYDFYAVDSGKGGDYWNEEAFSMLTQTGKNSWTVRNEDIIARPYPLRSSAKPGLLYFDARSKHAAIILTGKPVAAPTVIYVPRNIQYTNQFEVRATSPFFEWNDAKQLLYWQPNAALATNQIIIYPSGNFHAEALPAESRRMLGITTYRALCSPVGGGK